MTADPLRRPSEALVFHPVRARRPWPAACFLAAMATAVVLGTMPRPVAAADDPRLTRLATCKDSWFDWKDGDRRMAEYVNFVEDDLTAVGDGQSRAPKPRTTVLGVPIKQVYPQSIGMGVGFSVLANADFERVRQAFEKALGKPMTCATSDGMPGCQLEIGDRKTVTLIGGGRGSNATLAGCYYFYQQ